MNKAEFVSAISAKVEFTKKDTEKFLNAFMDCVTETLENGGKVQLVGFGTFEVVNRAKRVCRNPKTGGTMVIDPTIAPRFKPGKILKESIVNKNKK